MFKGPELIKRDIVILRITEPPLTQLVATKDPKKPESPRKTSVVYVWDIAV